MSERELSDFSLNEISLLRALYHERRRDGDLSRVLPRYGLKFSLHELLYTVDMFESRALLNVYRFPKTWESIWS